MFEFELFEFELFEFVFVFVDALIFSITIFGHSMCTFFMLWEKSIYRVKCSKYNINTYNSTAVTIDMKIIIDIR
jgi:hypothetical protein